MMWSINWNHPLHHVTMTTPQASNHKVSVEFSADASGHTRDFTSYSRDSISLKSKSLSNLRGLRIKGVKELKISLHLHCCLRRIYARTHARMHTRTHTRTQWYLEGLYVASVCTCVYSYSTPHRPQGAHDATEFEDSSGISFHLLLSVRVRVFVLRLWIHQSF